MSNDAHVHDHTGEDPHESAYAGLLGDDDSHWAFGTSFEDPLAGVDTTLPDGVDGADLAAYCLMLGDDALVFSHRLSQWCSNAPDLEEDIALANIALDLLGQARLLLARAAAADPSIVPALPEDSPVPGEDALAFFRGEADFRCVRMVEAAPGDFAETMARLLAFSTWRLAVLESLTTSHDSVLAAIAAKGVKEIAYHRDHAARWVVTLAQGTDFSRERMIAGLRTVWPYRAELDRVHPVEDRLAEQSVAVRPSEVSAEVDVIIDHVLATAGVDEAELSRDGKGVRPVGTARGRAGRDGLHSEALGHVLAEMQVVARAHPSGRW